MITEIQELLDRYQRWLREKTTLRQIDEWVEITTPYLDRHNDHLQIYAKKTSGGYFLTDDAYILTDLEMQGCKLDSAKRQSLLKQTLDGFGVRHNTTSGALEVSASPDNFPMRKHNLVQAMLAVNDLFYLAQPTVASLFYEDVVAWLDLSDIRFTPKVKFTGKTGYDHLFDFVIPKSRKQPERILQAVNRPTKEAAQSMAFSWIDTREVRSPDSKAFAFLNDSEHGVAEGVLDALRNYDVTPVIWSMRESVKETLAA